MTSTNMGVEIEPIATDHANAQKSTSGQHPGEVRRSANSTKGALRSEVITNHSPCASC
jgi:hypothetical protein